MVNELLLILSCAGASVPFALGNQLTPDGVFHTKPFTCPECMGFWLSFFALLLTGGNALLAGLAPIFTMAIRRYVG